MQATAIVEDQSFLDQLVKRVTHPAYIQALVLGASATYGALYVLGYAPLWFGPELREWSDASWNALAREEMAALSEQGYRLYRFKESNRNFLTPASREDPSRGVRRALFFSRKLLTLKGVVYFGADCEGPPRCVHGGCTAAFIDAALGVAAFRTARLPCLTASLTVNYRQKIPLGSTLGVEVKHDSTEGRKSFFSFKLYFLAVKPGADPVVADGTAIFINALRPSTKTGLPPFLALR